jgi:hypothetical protein
MRAKPNKPARPSKTVVSQKPDTPATADPWSSETGSLPAPLPPAQNHPESDSNCVDVTGKMPDDVRIDPDITEGHPGYNESGDSEIIPPKRFAKGKGRGGSGKSR